MYLNCHSYFSFKYGTMPVKELLEEAGSKGVQAFALTDINNTSACLEFIREAQKCGIRPIVGIDFRSAVKQHYIGIAKNNEGFRELNEHLSKQLCGERSLSSMAPEFGNCYVIYPFNAVHPDQLREHEYIGIRPAELGKLLFSDVRNHVQKLVILQPVTFRHKRDFNAHRLLRAIDNNTLLSKLPLSEQAMGTEIMYTEEELCRIFADYPALIRNTKKIIEECGISFEYNVSKNKKHFTTDAASDRELMRRLCYEGLEYRYPNPEAKIHERLEMELQAISNMGFCSYFLINHNILEYARHRNYFYVGRGSGANSLAAYCLQITDVDPVDLDLYFERFINPSRKNPPDFDIDFSWKDRDDIIRYVFEKYTTGHTALLATYNTFQKSSMIRELGKVFGLPKGEIDALVEHRKQIKPGDDSLADLVMKYGAYITDFPSHLSIHAGGILISEEPMHCYTATSLPPKGFPLTQFSMLEAEDIGLYKFDILSQRGLGHIKDSIELVKKNKNIDVDIRQVSAFKHDEKIKALLRTGRTMGCFYVESPAMRMLLKKLETDTYLGLVAASSIIRPGVAQSGMMREYILRFRYPERRQYIHPKIGELMQDTFGIMVYQEDVIKVAHFFAKLSLEQADVMRRGMSGKFRAREEFHKAKDDFFRNCDAEGYPPKTTEEVWRQIESFAGYSFSKGHSASYAVESYQSLYLKAYYPMEFMVGVINNFGGYYRTEYYIHEARMSGATVLAPCVNKSGQLSCIYNDAIYLGFIHLGELEENTSKVLLAEREKGEFNDLEDFIRRVSISVEQLRILVRIGAFRFSGKSKKALLWEIHSILGSRKKSEPRPELFVSGKKEFRLPELHHHPYDDALDEIEIMGFPLCSPFSLLKDPPAENMDAHELIAHVGKSISMIGYYVTHKITRTQKGLEMSFGTFLDSQGYFFDTTHFPGILERFPFIGKGCYQVQGKIVEEFGYPSVEVSFMQKLPYLNRAD